MAQPNKVADEMDLLIPVADKPPNKPPITTAPVRILNKEYGNISIIPSTGTSVSKLETHFFEITYLPDDPKDKVRKEIVKKNIIIKSKPKPTVPQSYTIRTKLILNQSKQSSSLPPNRAAFRVRMQRERIRVNETPEESESRRKKERERKRLSRLRIKQRKLALQSSEATESDNPKPPTPPPINFPQSVQAKVSPEKCIQNSEKENPQLEMSDPNNSDEDFLSKVREERRRAKNRERQRRFRERCRQGLRKQTDDSSNDSGLMENGKDSDDSLFCAESLPKEFLL